jgi:hypothetical protein
MKVKEIRAVTTANRQMERLDWLPFEARINGRLCAVRGHQRPGVPAFASAPTGAEQKWPGEISGESNSTKDRKGKTHQTPHFIGVF